MSKVKKVSSVQSYWTKERVDRLVMWYNRGLPYRDIASHFKGKSTNSIYKKLGRMGVLKASWSKRHG